MRRSLTGLAVALDLAFLALAACLWSPPARAQTAPSSEIQIKAAFLYRFGDFVEWPPAAFASAESAFAIGVIGADEVAAELERVVTDRRIHGRPVTVHRLRRGEPLGGLHMLFIGAAEAARTREILALARGQPMLTVTEAEQGLAAGSMINFVAVEDKVRFDVALAAAEIGQLRISSRLLGVARKVVTHS